MNRDRDSVGTASHAALSSRFVLLRVLLFVTTVGLLACSDEQPRVRPELEPGSEPEIDLDAGPARDARSHLPDRALPSQPARPTRSDASSAESCDGVDNDQNGIVDDVDLGADGICDCLAIGTIGEAVYPMDETFDAWLAARGSRPVVALGNEPLTPERLAPLQVLIVQDVRERSHDAAEIAALESWVRAGGGLLSLVGYVADNNVHVNALLAPFGVAYGSQLSFLAVGTVTWPVKGWNPHPVTQGVSQVGVQGAYAVLGDGQVLAQESDLLGGPPIVLLRALEPGAGKLLVYGDEWITYNSEWTDRTDYQIERLWQNALKWLPPSTECQVDILI